MKLIVKNCTIDFKGVIKNQVIANITQTTQKNELKTAVKVDYA